MVMWLHSGSISVALQGASEAGVVALFEGAAETFGVVPNCFGGKEGSRVMWRDDGFGGVPLKDTHS